MSFFCASVKLLVASAVASSEFSFLICFWESVVITCPLVFGCELVPVAYVLFLLYICLMRVDGCKGFLNLVCMNTFVNYWAMISLGCNNNKWILEHFNLSKCPAVP